MKKRIIGILLTVIMIVGIIPLGAVGTFAEDDTPITEYAYIVVEGEAFIDTGYTPNQNTRVVMDVDVQSEDEFWFCVTTPYDRNFGLGNIGNGIEATNHAQGLYNGFNQEVVDGSLVPIGRHTLEIGKNGLWIDSNLIKTYTTEDFTAPAALALFTQSRWGEYFGARDFQKVVCYGCKIYDNTSLVRNFVPYMQNGESGLYDTVRGQFYSNANIVKDEKGNPVKDENGKVKKIGLITAAKKITDPAQGLPAKVDYPIILDFDGTVTVSNDSYIVPRTSESAITIADGRNVTIKIEKDVILSARGGDAKFMAGAGAGIYVPENATLNVIGEGTLAAQGGSAADGENGGNGGSGSIQFAYGCWGSSGGYGGYGGGGAGAGIGTPGGRGGYRGTGGRGTNGSFAFPNNNVFDEHNGGVDGGDGHASYSMGTLNIASTLTLYVAGGKQGIGGAAGNKGNQAFDVGSGWENNHTAGGSGGGGGGQGGGAAPDFGTGGQGGGGGGGGSGAGIVYHSTGSFYHIPSYGGYGGGNTDGKANVNLPGMGKNGASETKTIEDYYSDRKDAGVHPNYPVYPAAVGGEGGNNGTPYSMAFVHENRLLSNKLRTTDTLGTAGKEETYFVATDTNYIATTAGENGLAIANGATVHIVVLKGVTLTCIGGDASGRTTGGGAGILVPENANLYLEGEGTVKATGGKAADGAAGSRGQNAVFEGYKEIGLIWDSMEGDYYGGNGGAGGAGGAGGGAAIGTAGAIGGNGGAGGSGDGGDIDDDHIDRNKLPGTAGMPGATANKMGYLSVNPTVKISLAGGAAGKGGAGGENGASAYSGAYYKDFGRSYSAGGGAGGGGGQGGGAGATVGRGGQGGGGGAGGNGNVAIYHSAEDPYEVHANGGFGGGHTEGTNTGGNNGADGKGCYDGTGYSQVFYSEYYGNNVPASRPGGAGGATGEHTHVYSNGKCISCSASAFVTDIYGLLTRYLAPNDTVIVMPNTVKKIKNSLFKDNKIIEKVVLPASLEEIGYDVFLNCTSLTEVTVEDNSNLKIIGNSSFGNTRITEFTVPASVEEIGHNAFQNCSALTTVTFTPGANLKILNSTFADTGLTAIDFPETVTAIGYSAFANCTKLKSITVHWTDAESLVTPESSAFDGIASDCLLTVPKGTLELYRNDPVWSKFLNIAVEPHEHDFSGIYVPNDADTHSKKCLYCDEYSDDGKLKHTFVDGACSVCGYRCKHNFEEDWGICTLCGQEEQAYINREWDAEKHIVVSHKETIPEIAKKITKDTTELTSGWYILCESVEIPEGKHITVNGDVHIVLYSGCELKIPAPESGYPGIQLSEGNSLTVYGRMDDTGSIVSYGDFGGEEHGGAGIGGLNIENAVYGIKSANSGTLNVCGGIVKAYGGSYASAIGGGYGGSGGEFNIYGGTVIAENVGLADGAGIGSGFNAEIYIPGDEGLELVETSAGIINIFDGTVTAKGRGAGAGIGGGNGADGGIVTIYGGDITATSGCGFVSGIGDGWAMTDDGVVRVDGGSVNVIPQTGTAIHVTRNNIELVGSPYSEATQIGGLLNYESIGDAADIMTPQVVKVTTENHIVTSLGAKIKTDTSSLRLGAFYNGKILDDEQREAVKDLGMIFYPKHLLGEETLDLDNTNAVRMSATGIEEFDTEKTFEDYETFTFYVTIVGIPENGWNTKIAFRPYIILGDDTIEYGKVMERCYNDVVALKLK